MSLDHRFPTIADLRRRARWRIPAFVWGYLDGGAGGEQAIRTATEALDRVKLMPGILGGEPEPDLSVELFGRRYRRPFGVAPVGMSGVVWPDAEAILARMAAREGIPYAMSTVAAATPEEIGPKAGAVGWFQLYAPLSPELRRKILARVRDAGFHTLVFTLDAPILSRRPREMRARLANPMKLTPRILAQVAMRPAWAMGMVGRPIPRPRLFDAYGSEAVTRRPDDKHIGVTLRCIADVDYFKALRDDWDGPLIAKGVLDPASVKPLLDAGADGLWVSSHGGRQLEAAPAPADMLPEIRAIAGPEVPILYDGGIRSGTDVLRVIALGADMAMLGRAFHYGLGAAGADGAAHVAHILAEEMRIDMAQLTIDRPADARGRLIAPKA